jgi:hypothetical protein
MSPASRAQPGVYPHNSAGDERSIHQPNQSRRVAVQPLRGASVGGFAGYDPVEFGQVANRWPVADRGGSWKPRVFGDAVFGDTAFDLLTLGNLSKSYCVWPPQRCDGLRLRPRAACRSATAIQVRRSPTDHLGICLLLFTCRRLVNLLAGLFTVWVSDFSITDVADLRFALERGDP